MLKFDTAFLQFVVTQSSRFLTHKPLNLEDQWEQIFWDLIPLFEAFFKMWDRHSLSMITERWSDNLGFVSHRFNRWIICVGDPEKCPNLDIFINWPCIYN